MDVEGAYSFLGQDGIIPHFLDLVVIFVEPGQRGFDEGLTISPVFEVSSHGLDCCGLLLEKLHNRS